MREIRYILNKLVWVAYVSLWWAVFVFPDRIVLRASWFSYFQDTFPLAVYALVAWTLVGAAIAVSYIVDHWKEGEE